MSYRTVILLSLSLLVAPLAAAQVEEGAADAETKALYPEVQRETVHLSLVGINSHSAVRMIQEQVYGLSGMRSLVPHLSAPGLITYNVQFMGYAKGLYTAIQETLGNRFAVDLKATGPGSWEITLKPQ